LNSGQVEKCIKANGAYRCLLHSSQILGSDPIAHTLFIEGQQRTRVRPAGRDFLIFKLQNCAVLARGTIVRLRIKVTAAIRNAARLTTRRVPQASTLSPLALLSGHNPSHEEKCASVFHRPMSSSTSLIKVWATMTSMPSIHVRSTPVMHHNSL
jgi:hypothetical protein